MDIWNLAADLGLTVRERRGVHRSGYAPGANHIDLTPGMGGRVLRGVMCHEIAHHVLGHLRGSSARSSTIGTEGRATE